MLVVEDRTFINGVLAQVTLGYFAQADDGAVYSFGEDVNVYSAGAVVSTRVHGDMVSMPTPLFSSCQPIPRAA